MLYDNDNQSKLVTNNFNATAAVLHSSQLEGSDRGGCRVKETTEEPIECNADAFDLCVTDDQKRNDSCRAGDGPLLERFWDQPVVSECTAVLVKRDLVVTARHCVEGLDEEEIRIVFGFEEMERGSCMFRLDFDEGQVYAGVEIFPERLEEQREPEDWVVIRLDRFVPETIASPVKLSGSEISLASVVYAVGHPRGLPKKYTGTEEAMSASAVDPSMSDERFFRARLNGYQGNSGAPVFSYANHELVGIITEGERDFHYLSDGKCFRSTAHEYPRAVRRRPVSLWASPESPMRRGELVNRVGLFRDAVDLFPYAKMKFYIDRCPAPEAASVRPRHECKGVAVAW